MDTTSNWIPNFHPLLVHFPIALLFVAMGIELLGLLLKKYQQFSFITDTLVWIGTLLGIFTVISGLQAADSFNVSGDIKDTLDAHSLTAKITITFFILYSVARIFRYRKRENLKPTMTMVNFVFGCIGLFGIYKTGEKGAELVFKHNITFNQKNMNNKEIFKKFWIDVFEKGNPDMAIRYITKDAVNHQAMSGQKAGLEGIIESFRMFHSAFPEVKVTIEDMIAEGDKVVALVAMKGIQKGPFMGAPASNKEITIRSIDIVKFKDGKMVEHWAFGNDVEIANQMGMDLTHIEKNKTHVNF
jgi:steroid delta-isomerase-like uncharacterized protein